MRNACKWHCYRKLAVISTRGVENLYVVAPVVTRPSQTLWSSISGDMNFLANRENRGILERELKSQERRFKGSTSYRSNKTSSSRSSCATGFDLCWKRGMLNPYNPGNNVNYTSADSDFAEDRERPTGNEV